MIKLKKIDTLSLSRAGFWVRRQKAIPCLTDEALCLAEIQHTWNLHRQINFEQVHTTLAEVSSPYLTPTWFYLLEVHGRRLTDSPLVPNHPLARVAAGEPLRLLALVQPPALSVPGVLVETASTQRMLWATQE